MSAPLAVRKWRVSLLCEHPTDKRAVPLLPVAVEHALSEAEAISEALRKVRRFLPAHHCRPVQVRPAS